MAILGVICVACGGVITKAGLALIAVGVILIIHKVRG